MIMKLFRFVRPQESVQWPSSEETEVSMFFFFFLFLLEFKLAVQISVYTEEKKL